MPQELQARVGNKNYTLASYTSSIIWIVAAFTFRRSSVNVSTFQIGTPAQSDLSMSAIMLGSQEKQ